MSLKAFHVLFVTACLTLGITLAAWGLDDWRATSEGSSLAVMIVGFVLALGAVPYAFWFLRKLKNVSYL